MNQTQDRYLPALRCRMGDWIYYVACMPFEDIGERVRPAAEIHASEPFDEFIHSKLTSRSKNIAHYLVSQEQRFFNTIVVGVYGGNPEWLDIGLLPSGQFDAQGLSEDVAENISQTLGLLHLTGQERLFAIDGQHRVEAIRQAIRQKDGLNEEEVSVIFVAHKQTPEGLQRTRRLFSTLNKYAKPVSKGDIVSLDEDDAFAIVTRRLVDEHPLLKGRRASPDKQARILRTDKRSFTSILTVYDVCMVLTLDSRRHWKKPYLTRSKPPDETIDVIYTECAEFWSALANHFPQIKDVMDTEPVSDIAGRYRTDQGGHLLFRPIGQMAFARAIRMLKDRGVSVEEATARLSSLPYELAEPPWPQVLWNTVSNTMITQVAQRDLAAKLLLYYAGYGIDQNALLLDYRRTTGNMTDILPTL